MDIALKLSVMFKFINSRRKSTSKNNINTVLKTFNNFIYLGCIELVKYLGAKITIKTPRSICQPLVKIE